MSVTLQQQIAESIVGQIEWKDSALGYCVCPGRERHTKPDGPRDCMVRVEKDPSGYQPGVYCFHTSCGPPGRRKSASQGWLAQVRPLRELQLIAGYRLFTAAQAPL